MMLQGWVIYKLKRNDEKSYYYYYNFFRKFV
jgi:hypothetical protein